MSFITCILPHRTVRVDTQGYKTKYGKIERSLESSRHLLSGSMGVFFKKKTRLYKVMRIGCHHVDQISTSSFFKMLRIDMYKEDPNGEEAEDTNARPHYANHMRSMNSYPSSRLSMLKTQKLSMPASSGSRSRLVLLYRSH